jgi:hypothetical protein
MRSGITDNLHKGAAPPACQARERRETTAQFSKSRLANAAEATGIGNTGDQAPNLVSCFRTLVFSGSLSRYQRTVRFAGSVEALMVQIDHESTKVRKHEKIKNRTRTPNQSPQYGRRNERGTPSRLPEDLSVVMGQ